MRLPFSWHPSLRVRILAPAALVAIPAIALIIYIGLEQRDHTARAVEETAERLAKLKALHQQVLVESTRALLTAIALSRDVRSGDGDVCSAYVREIVARLGATYTNVGVLDKTGTPVCGSPAVPPADRPDVRRALAAGQFVVGEYTPGRGGGQPSLPFFHPVVDTSGNVELVAFAALDLERQNARLGEGEWPQGATMLVTDRNETIVAMHPDGAEWIGRSLKNDPVTRLMGSRTSGTVAFHETDETETEVFAFERVIPLETGLTVRVLLPSGRRLAAANWGMYQTLVGFSLIALVVLAGVKAASDRLLLEPIAHLTGASSRIAAGDLRARAASSTSIPELNALGKGFDDMAASLEEREAARLRVERERDELQQQYHQAQKMDAVGRLAGGIAHDFNNMLTAILGYCELLLDDPTLTERQRSDIREIERAGQTAAQLTRQLLAFSRREIVEPAVLDLNAVVSGMDNMLHRLVGEDIVMTTALDERLHRVKADRGQIEQVILNLAVNARDAMPQGGRLTIATANASSPGGIASAHLSAPPGDYVMLSVADTGAGMPADVLAHLFEPFFTTKAVGKGTGLGLATVYGIVKQNYGAIAVESAEARGSTFRIYFPRCDERAAAQAPQAVRPARGKATVLIVEDDPGIRELSAKILRRSGYEVLVAEGGEEAREITLSHDGVIHLLLSDVVMPGMNGPTVAEMLTRLRPGLKVVYMSGFTDNTIVREGVMERGMPFLQKPFTPERLANKIAEVLG